MKKQRNRSRIVVVLALSVLAAAFVAVAAITHPALAQSQPIRALSTTDQALTSEQQQAQSLAIASPVVRDYVGDSRGEVFQVFSFNDPYDPAYKACADGTCRQVDIFAFDQLATVTAIVHLGSDKVIDAWLVPNSHPLINPRLYNRAVEIIQNDPDVEAALGFVPSVEQIRLMDGENTTTECKGARLCAGVPFFVDSGAVWVLVDLHDETIEKIWWAAKPYNVNSPQDNPIAERIPEDCGTTIHVAREGWNLDYRTTPTDALEITNLTFDVNGTPQQVATRLKLAQWHARYTPTGGFRDYTGCGGGGGGYAIYPYGNTQIRTLYDHLNNPIGFEVVQDFRMSNWGAHCNYRYEQHFEFYQDGRYRVKAGAYGQGCGDNMQEEATYRPVMVMDVAVDGDAGDTLSLWDGAQWVDQATEAWWLQSAPYTTEGYRYKIADQNGVGYYVEPGQGQFDDFGTGDNAYMYLTLHRASESDGDLPLLPGSSCCNSDYRQGPHSYTNGEAVANQNITLWYVPASATITTWMVNNGFGDRQYCWTENTSTTWPCYAGPMFVPTTQNQCSPLDFDCDFTIDAFDIAAVANHWGCVATGDTCYESQYDLNSDLAIDIVDVLIDASRWGCQLGDACYVP
jgi:hypothetical protein